jgi:hypothetical protein
VSSATVVRNSDELVLRSRDNFTLTFRVVQRWVGSSDPVLESVDFYAEIDALDYVGRTTGSTHYVGSPSALFDSIANSWRGWTGTKEWHDETRQVALIATSDTTGHAKLVVELSDVRDEFLCRATLIFDAGQLDDMALRVREVFG